MKGWRPDYYSIVTQKAAYTAANALTGTKGILGLAYWEDPASNANSGKIIVAVSNAKVWRMQYQESGAVGTFTDCTGTATVHDGINITYQIDFLNGILIGVGNSAAADPPFKLSSSAGNAAALGGTPPIGECVKVINNFAFIAGDITNGTTKSTLRWSNASDPETWNAGSSLTVNLGDGDVITALGSIGTDLYIFKTRSIWRLSTVTTSLSGVVSLGPLTKVSDQQGAMNKFAVDNLPDGSIVFMGRDAALYRMDGTTIVKLSDYPPPGASVSNGLVSDLLPAGVNFLGLNLKVYKNTNAVICNSYASLNPFIYDYVQNLWYQYAITLDGTVDACYSLAIAPPTRPSTSTGNPYSLIIGSGNGLIKIFEAGAAFTGQASVVTIDVPLQVDQKDFLPLSVIFSCEVGSSFGVKVGWDGTINSTNSLTVSSATRTKYVMAVPLKEAASGIPFRSMQIQITSGTTGSTTLYPIWVSDQVLS